MWRINSKDEWIWQKCPSNSVAPHHVTVGKCIWKLLMSMLWQISLCWIHVLCVWKVIWWFMTWTGCKWGRPAKLPFEARRRLVWSKASRRGIKEIIRPRILFCTQWNLQRGSRSKKDRDAADLQNNGGRFWPATASTVFACQETGCLTFECISVCIASEQIDIRGARARAQVFTWASAPGPADPGTRLWGNRLKPSQGWHDTHQTFLCKRKSADAERALSVAGRKASRCRAKIFLFFEDGLD